MVFVYTVGTVLVTWKTTVQVLLALIVPPVRVTTFGVPLTPTVPLHWLIVGVPTTVKFVDDRVSVIDTPLITEAVAFVNVTVTVEGFPSVMVVGEKAFDTDISPLTVRLAVTVAGLVIVFGPLPMVALKLPAGMVFVRTEVPRLVGVVTVKVITQVFGEAGVPPAAVLPPVIVTELAVDVTTPVMH
jgi:hypothetical protein